MEQCRPKRTRRFGRWLRRARDTLMANLRQLWPDSREGAFALVHIFYGLVMVILFYVLGLYLLSLSERVIPGLEPEKKAPDVKCHKR